MNKALISGRLTRTPELKTTSGGKEYTAFTVAVNRRFKNQDGQYDADFISCKAWNKTAEFVSRYFAKGDGIILVGRIETGRFEGKDGHTVYTTDVMVEEVYFPVGGKSRNQDEQELDNEQLPFDL